MCTFWPLALYPGVKMRAFESTASDPQAMQDFSESCASAKQKWSKHMLVMSAKGPQMDPWSKDQRSAVKLHLGRSLHHKLNALHSKQTFRVAS